MFKPLLCFALLYSGGQQIDDVVDHNPKTILKNPAAYITAGQELNARISVYGAQDGREPS